MFAFKMRSQCSVVTKEAGTHWAGDGDAYSRAIACLSCSGGRKMCAFGEGKMIRSLAELVLHRAELLPTVAHNVLHEVLQSDVLRTIPQRTLAELGRRSISDSAKCLIVLRPFIRMCLVDVHTKQFKVQAVDETPTGRT